MEFNSSTIPSYGDISESASVASRTFEEQVKCLIAASEEKIGRLEVQVRDLLCIRDRERGLVATLKLIIAPIRKLPAELLTEIFLYTGVTKRDVIRISHVCAYWRQLSHNTPALWRRALPAKVAKSDSPEHVAAAKAWLDRSAPLTIPMTFASTISPAVLDLLLSTAPRWETLDVNDRPHVLTALAKLPSDALKQLRAVQIYGKRDGHLGITSAFLCAPLLRGVTLSIAPFTEDFPMPWAQLTQLILTDPRLHICLSILVQCTSLVYANIDTDMDGDSFSIPELVTLPELQTFFLSIPGGNIAPCFQSLTLPKLTKLELRHYSTDTLQWPLAASSVFPQFLRRSQNLRYFSLYHCNLNPRELYDILLHSPSLTELVLENCRDCIDDFLLSALQYSLNETVHLAPRLQRLKIHFVDDCFDEDVLESMICSRWWTADDLSALTAPPPVAAWKYVSIWRAGNTLPFTPSFEIKMQQLKAQGLDVNVA
ncbi:hypothetical protein R3P38DRAFT_2867227 [Favolaschia claudopus]|uniref:F-box domain-containing protein n=1 Tax=Favolaschia claudopus TaxID=2862362 RepID=A0AAW0D9H9_9AGAR